MFILAVRYPNIDLALTAQTKENAAELLRDKFNEILKFYPFFENEISRKDCRFSKNDAEIKFKNGSRIDILQNGRSALGQRRKRMSIEEAAQLNDELFQEVLLPIVEVGRTTCGKLAIVDPLELNQQVHFYTTSWFRKSDEFNRSISMVKDMINLKSKMVLGSSWQLPCWYNRGSTKEQIIEKKRSMSPVKFALNYESKWVGAFSDALIDINKLIKARVLTKAILECKDRETYIGVDVARSQDTTNNQTSIVVIEAIRNKNGKITHLDCINLINISNALNFDAQAIEVKRVKKLYNAKVVVVDANGVGSGCVDALMKEQIDPYNGETLPCLNTINSDALPEKSNAETCIYEIKAQTNNTEMIVNFINIVESGKLRLLEKRQDADYDLKDRENYEENILPFIQTDFLVEEISNLQLEHLNNGKLSIKKLIKRMNKDRFSAIEYVCWYIMTHEEGGWEDSDNFEEMLKYTLFF